MRRGFSKWSAEAIHICWFGILCDDTARRTQVASLKIVPTAYRMLVNPMLHIIEIIAVTPSTVLRINEGFGCQPKN